MVKNSFISNFKKLPCAFLLAVVVICIVEYVNYRQYDGRLFSHEVDRVLYQLKTGKFHADYLLIGDSVGLQLSRQYSRKPGYLVLATNQAIEMTGQFFLVKRYMEKNPSPKAVIFAAHPFLEFNLEQVYTENFVLRTFTRLNEILSVFLIKHDLTMMAKMITYKFLFSYKHRLSLQKELVGFSNANIYSGMDMESNSMSCNQYSLIKLYDGLKSTEKSAAYYFNQLVGLLNGYDVDFYYIPLPVKEQKELPSLLRQYRELFSHYLPLIRKKYPHFHYVEGLVEYPKDLFVDHVHFNAEGLSLAEPYMNKIVGAISRKYADQAVE